MRRWLEAWHQPIPVPRKTACAWLLAQRAPAKDHSDPNGAADKAARAAFDGAGQQEGEWSRQIGLQRLIPDFDAVRAWLPEWAPALYGPLLDAVQTATGDGAASA